MEDFFNAYLNLSNKPKLNINLLNGFIGKPYEESKHLIQKYLDDNKLNNYFIVGYGNGHNISCDYNINRIVIHNQNNIVKKITIG